VGIEAAYSSSPPHRRLATIVADPTIISPTSMLSPQYGLTVWAPEALVVLVVVEPVAVLVPVEVAELEVGAAVAGKEESFASVVYSADRPVTFLQIPEGVIEPATKLTVEHWYKMPSGASCTIPMTPLEPANVEGTVMPVSQ